MPPVIEIRTGSDSDIPKIRAAHETLAALGVPFQERILSAHRTPQLMADEARRLEGKGVKVSIAAAGGAAHLPGMTALLAAQILALDDPDLMRRVRLRKGLTPGATPPKSMQVGLLGLKPPPELLDLLQRFGLTPREATSPAGPERDGVCALIAICDRTNLDLPSSLAARTHLPVIALPLLHERFDPFEAMLGTSPLAGMGINRPKNAAIYAAMIAGRREPLREYRESLRRESEAKDAKLTSPGTRRP
jgi:phosphoribosylcarboxyaminoimidazole (NCAIR) mutase